MQYKDSSVNNKCIAKNTVLLYFRMLLVLIVNLYTSRIILSSLGEIDFGLYNVVGGVVATLTFVSMAMANSTARFMTYAIGVNILEYRRKVFSTALTIHMLIALCVFVLAETIGLWFMNTKMVIPDDRIVSVNWVYQFSIILTCFSIANSPFNSLIIAHERMGIFAFVSVFDVIMKLLIASIISICSGERLTLYAALLLVIQIIEVLFGWVYCKSKFHDVNVSFVRDWNLIKEMGSFASWSLIGNMSHMCYTHGLNILLNIFFGPVVNAARGISVQVQSAVMNFINSFQVAVSPQVTKSYAQGDIDRQMKLVYTCSRMSFFLLLAMLLPIELNTKVILGIWLENVPDHTVNFVRLVLIISILDCLSRPLTVAMNATGKIKKYQMVSCGIMLAILPLSYISLSIGLFPESVYMIHFIMYILSLYAEIRFLNALVNRKMNDYLKEVVIPIIKVSIMSLPIPLIVSYYINDNLLHSLFSIASSILCVIFISFYIGMSKYERSRVKSFVKSKL